MTRPASLLIRAATLALLTSAPSLGIAQEPGGPLHRLTDHAWSWIAPDDRSSNSALIVGDTAALVVDPGLTPAIAREFLAAVRRVTNLPIRWAVLTHWHPDHALGAVCLADREFSIVAHPKTRRSLAERAAAAARNLANDGLTVSERSDLAACSVHLPETIVPVRRTFDLGGRVVEVFHPGWSHTAGDLVIWEPNERVLVTGDMVMHAASPFMDEGRPLQWARAVDSLIGLSARAVVAGHFGPSRPADLDRFGAYLHALIDRVTDVADSIDPDSVPGFVTLPSFADFGQYPQYNATIAGNAGRVLNDIRSLPVTPGTRAGFDEVASLELGQNPHQIAFSEDGRTGFIAVAGADRVAVVDGERFLVLDSIAASDTPLGVVPIRGDDGIVTTRFRGDSIVRYRRSDGRVVKALGVGGQGASLFSGPLPDGAYLVSVESTDRVHRLDPTAMELTATYATGRRPFPPAATADGRLAFVPNYDDGTVTVIDLWNNRVADTVFVGEHPSGGVVLPGDREYAVAVRGEDKILFINTASHRVVDSLVDGIGDSPFSIVVTPSGRLAFVNNTASNDISVVDLEARRVVARVPAPDTPIVMAVHPSGKTVWISSEGIHRLTVLSIPSAWRQVKPSTTDGTTEVAVMGMIHGAHLTSARWGLAQVEETIRRFRPDAICAEIAPDRWERIWSDFAERGVIEDPRVLRFPEYVRTILPLAVELGFEIIPCAGWTQEMSDLRQQRIAQFDSDPAFAAAREAYAARLRAVRAGYDRPLASIDDPQVIHSPEYDRRTSEELELYDQYQNDWIGPGGWTNINRAHLELIDQAIRSRRGRRVLITFGAGHKYRFLDSLRSRQDVRLLDLKPYLP